MKPLVVNDEAADELEEAIGYYETRSHGIGLNLASKVSEVFQKFNVIRSSIHLIRTPKVQKCHVQRFPYTVFYIELNDSVVIIAVARQKRRPDYWKRRPTGVKEPTDIFEANIDRKP